MTSRNALVVCGLDREAVRVRHPASTVIVSGGNVVALEHRLQAVDPAKLKAVVSFGLAGGLDPSLSVGDVVVPSAVWTADEQYPVDRALMGGWLERASRGTLALNPVPSIAGVDKPVATVAEKAALRQQSDSVAVDMESHIAAAYALRHALPFGVLRVISDTAERAIPPAAIAALREDGGIDVPALFRSLVRNPKQLPALIRTAREGSRAFNELSHAGLLLQLHLYHPDFD